MSQAVDVKEDDYTIRWDDDLGSVVHEWQSFVSGEDFRTAFQDLLEVVEDRGASTLLIDQREMNVIDDDDMVWLVDTWVPAVTEAGLEYSVVVIQESVVAEMNTDQIMEAVGEIEGDNEVTTDIDEARRMVRTY